MRKIIIVFAAVLSVALIGCASLDTNSRQRQVASVLAYLFPGSESTPPVPDQPAELKVPFRIGVAFVPDSASTQFRLPENDRLKLADEVRDSFRNYPFIKDIVSVPSIYLEPGGGFANLNRVAALLNLDVIALVSFDQVQNAGANGWSFLYWTGIGAYAIEGDQYDILTAVEATVFDVKSRRLLMRGGGISHMKGTATWIGFTEKAREARTRGFDEAVKEMIQKLHDEVKSFRERAPKDPNIRLILPPGYKP
jgi:rhombotail lipoprotein